MKAFVLAAGYGKRLEPLTKAVPKPMVPVANKPIMQYNIELLKKHGVKEVICNIHYFPEQIKNYFGDGSEYGIKFSYSYEEELLGTAGGVLNMAKLTDIKGTFIVISSDILTDVNLTKMLAFHKKKNAIATIALTPVEDVTQFGVVQIDGNDRICGFQEKPKKAGAKSNLVNTGIYIFEPAILEMIPKDSAYDFGHQLFPKLVADVSRFFGYKMVEYWNDVGGPEKLMSGANDVLKGIVMTHFKAKKIGRSTWTGKDAKIAKTAKFDGSILIGDNAVIGENVEMYGSVAIGDKCVIDDGTIITDSFIWSDSKVGKDCRINKSIIGNWCTLEDKAKIEENSILANRCHIKAGKRVDAGSKLSPDTHS
jgi:NDP-sugar pyrophosphorylase family protein